MAAIITLVIIAAVIGFTFFIIRKSKDRSNTSWVKFYAKGKEAGFSSENINLLKELAQRACMEHPAALFWSQVQMDTCIKKFVNDIKQDGSENLSENQEFLLKLYNFRKKMEMERPIYKNGITSSRNIDELQAAQVVALNIGAFKSKIVNNKSANISIERPDNLVLPPDFSWKGSHLLLYFWRKNDAGYCFETDVIDEQQLNKPPLLIVRHSDKLLRTQSRKSLRVKTHRIAMLYRVEDRSAASKPEVMSGVKCYLEDISDSGCALKAGGAVSTGMRVIVQFVIDKTPLSISGVVRSVEHDKEKNTSILHIESDLMPASVKNKIFGVMFGILTDDADVAAIVSNPGVNQIGPQTPIVTSAETSGVNGAAIPPNASADKKNNETSENQKNKNEEYDDSHDFDFFNWDDQSKTENDN